ncbi:MAG: hypothetical protein OIF36_05195 [Alphaproteobacteria bacterium]|nr:hypothetical protein [Alphaproteobacteria bacterium]
MSKNSNKNKKINFVTKALEILRTDDYKLEKRQVKYIQYNKSNYKNKINKYLNKLHQDHPDIKDVFLYVKTAMYMLKRSRLNEDWDKITQSIEDKFKNTKNNTSKSSFNYFRWAKDELKESDFILHERACNIPKDVVNKMNKAMNNLTTESNYLVKSKNIDLKKVFLINLRAILRHKETFKILSKKIPDFMKFRLETNKYTDPDSLKTYRNEYRENLLKPRLLIHIAKNSSVLKDVYGIRISDIHLTYRKALEEKGLFNKKYASKYHLNRKSAYILSNVLTVDHISEISAFGVIKDSKSKNYDPVFKQDLYEINSSSNLCLIEHDLNQQKADLKNIQSKNAKKTNMLFLNLVPIRDPRRNSFMANHKIREEEERPKFKRRKTVKPQHTLAAAQKRNAAIA